ncbi:MAG: hypothetical protein E7659_07015 [Ruminococcaceae bacterium]|nr:hypothetical protein [Oscillospiraceae bacterium]
MGSLLLEKSLDFPQSFGIMCITTRKERGNDRLKTILSSEINLAQMQDLLSSHSPETEDEKYTYDIIQKAYWINEKKIEMLDYKKQRRLVENYYKYFGNTKK